MSLHHPDRFAHEPDKLATYEKLTAAINHAKDRGDLGTLRQIAGDPHGFILSVILSEAEALRSAVEGSPAISGNDWRSFDSIRSRLRPHGTALRRTGFFARSRYGALARWTYSG